MQPFMNALYAGLGALSITKEKAEKTIADLVKRGEMSESAGAELVGHLLNAAEQQEKEFEGRVAGAVQRILHNSGVPTRKDFQTLASRLESIEKAMGAPGKRNRGRKA